MPGTNPRRIGVLGGTFDPPHNGHVLAGIEARDRLNLDLVLLTVANDPWQKTGVGGPRESGLTPAEVRLEMVRAAVDGVEGLEADDLEMQRGGPTYTADTLSELERRHPGAELFLLVGSDAASSLESWVRPDDVQQHATIVVIDRPGHDGGRPPSGWDFELLEAPLLDMSSEGLRRQVESGLSVRSDVPDAVADLIDRYGLYESSAVSGEADPGVGAKRSGEEQSRRSGSRSPAATAWRWGFPIALLVAVIWSGTLMVDGLRTILNSEDGQTHEAVTDPLAPGFEAFVEQTWSMMVVTEDEDSNLVGLTILAVSDRTSGGGTALVVPPSLALDACGGNACSLADLHATDGIANERAYLGSLLGSDFTGVALLTPTSWTNIVEPVSPLPIGLKHDLYETAGDGASVVRFSAAENSLEAADVVDLLALPDRGGSVGLLRRHAMFWESWLSAVSAGAGPSAHLPAVDVELVRLLEVLALGEIRVESSPWIVSGDSMAADPVAMDQIADRMFPFPIPPDSGSAPTVRLLNGTGDPTIDAYARQVVRSAGVDIAVVGNFRNFNVIQTRVVYRDPAMEQAATALAVAIHAGVIFDEASSPVADLTVVVGADFTSRAG